RAWAALALGHAESGNPALALAAARSRMERARALGLADELQDAIRAGAELADRLGLAGPDASEMLEARSAASPRITLVPLPGSEPTEPEAGSGPVGAAAAPEALAPASDAPASAAAALPDAPPPETDALLGAGPVSGAEPLPDLSLVPALDLEVDLGLDDEGEDPAALRETARLAAERALAAETPAARAEGLIDSAEALSRAGAAPEEVRAAIELACEADPEGPAPWRARARLEAKLGDPLAAARAHLSVSIRTEGEEAAAAALEAARLFESRGRHGDAARAYRAAIHAQPGCVPARSLLAEEALAAGDPATAAAHLSAVDPGELPSQSRASHQRTLARALEAANRSGEAEPVWAALLRDDPGDREAFDRAAALAAARGDVEAWVALARLHEAALPGEELARRRDLRRARGELLVGAGRPEAAREDFLAALGLDPGDAAATEALAALDGRGDLWSQAAASLATEAEASTGEAAAALHLRRARLLAERLRDPASAAVALEQALVHARASGSPDARRIADEATALLAALYPPGPEPEPQAAGPVAPSPLPADPVAAVLRGQALALDGVERAELLERLAGHLERTGDAAGAADALLEALEADPERELTWSWLLGLAEGDPERLARAEALRARAGVGGEPVGAAGVGMPEAALETHLPATGPEREGPAGGGAETPPAHEPIDLDAFDLGPPATLSPDQIPWAEPDGSGEDGAVGGATTGTAGTPVPDTATPDTATTADILTQGPSGDAPGTAAGTAVPDIATDIGTAGSPELLVPDTAGSPVPLSPLASPMPDTAEAADIFTEGPSSAGSPVPDAAASVPASVPDTGLAGLADTGVGFSETTSRGALGTEASPHTPAEEGLNDEEAPPSDPRLALPLQPSTAPLAFGRNLPPAAPAEPPPGDVPTATLASDSGSTTPGASEPSGDGDAARPEAEELLVDVELPAGPRPDLVALGRAHMGRGEWLPAHDWLAEALARDPGDLTIARDLSRVAEKLGLFSEYVTLGEACADAIAAYDPLAAAARYRHFAEILGTKLEEPERAAVMLEKALALVPEDTDTRRALLDSWSGRPDTAARALDEWLEIARHDPTDAGALSAAAAACRELAAKAADPAAAARLAERGRLAASLASFARPDQPAPPPPRLAGALPSEVRDRIAAPGATGPVARLLSTLGPWLEPLFPADLARRGASPASRLTSPRAPALLSALETAARALGTRPHAVFLTDRPGYEIFVENTQPPAIVASAGIAELSPGELGFLAARTLDLLQHGWSLAGKFAPRDVGILLELACRFAGGAPPPLGLPGERAGAFLAVLEVSVPRSAWDRARALAPAASAEVGAADPRALAAALRRTANRVALLHAGDPADALRALALLDRRLESGPVDPARALALPDLRDVALFALSDPFLDLRLALLGETA
ncbi:MAG TPA: hypothetical protein VML50_18745, partial [Anaeromyxobacter sp.]|nr:hypothetical protein [Anaeromyxobacter sp.]